MKAFTEKELKKLFDKYDFDDVMESMLVFLMLEDIAKTDSKEESKLQMMIREYVSEEYLNKTLTVLDDYVLKVAIDFYNRIFKLSGEETISLEEFRKFYNHRLGIEKIDSKLYENFTKKIQRAYMKAF